MFILLVLFFPESCRSGIENLFAPPQSGTLTAIAPSGAPIALSPYSPQVAALDKALTSGTPLPPLNLPVALLKPLVAARRIAGLGRTSAKEVSQVVEIVTEFEDRIDGELTELSKQAMRSVRNQRIDEACRRVSLPEITTHMNLVDTQFANL